MSEIMTELRRRIVAALCDGEVARLSPGLATAVRIALDDEGFRVVFDAEGPRVDDCASAPLKLSAAPIAWAQVLQTPPPPRYHSFSAFQLANRDFSLDGDLVEWARARPVLERLFELVAASPEAKAAPIERDLSQITGHYRTIEASGETYEVYYEVAGQGIPIMFLHTAGADGRQFLGQMADVGLARDFRMYAVDMPFHGRSMPPRGWDGSPYVLTSDLYRGWCSAMINQIVGPRAIVVGGSMGAAMAMVLAAENAPQLLGAIAIEPPYQSRGRRNPYQNHVGVHGGLHNSSFVRGLMSPTSPFDERRRASWIYAQGAPGIYPGDLAFYSDEFDGAQIAPRIDNAATPMAFLCGEYDYSATPEDGLKLAKLVPGSLYLRMGQMGHFPMCEHPAFFRSYLVEALDFVRLNMRV